MKKVHNKTLLVIDGYNLIFRSFYVQPDLRSKNGMPVGALYGFITMLLKIVDSFQPHEIVIVLDSGGTNFRHELYANYKQNREKAPSELITQLKLLRTVIECLNIKVLEKVGLEADDIIATIARKAVQENKEMIIFSSDKDLWQLIEGSVKVYDPMKMRNINEEDIANKFGVPANKIREVQALAGDSADNIPGVKSIGPKTASKLIMEFNTIHNLYESIDLVQNKRQKELLLHDKDNAFISWQLVGLKEDLSLNIDFNDFVWLLPTMDKLSILFNDFGFKSLERKINKIFNFKDVTISSSSVDSNNNSQKSYNIIEVEDATSLESILKDFIDLGFISLYLSQEDKLNTIFFSNGYNVYYFVYENDDIRNQNELIQIFNNRILSNFSVKKILFEVKNYFYHLSENIVCYEDIELMYYCLNLGKEKKSIAEIIRSYDESKGSTYFPNVTQITLDIFWIYNILLQQLQKMQLLHIYYDIELPVSKILYSMERNGVLINIDFLRQLSLEFGEKLDIISYKIFDITKKEFNIASSKQLGQILFEELHLPYAKRSKKNQSYSTNSDVLTKLAAEGYEIANLVLQYRKLSKLKNSYTDTLPLQVSAQTGRLHTTFLQSATSTSRLSSHNPNIQNIPNKNVEGMLIRKAFVARENYKFISFDYSQIELRILSCVANIEELKDAFLANDDIHTKTAAQIFNVSYQNVTKDMRRKAKAINFGIIYGISSFGLANQLDISNSEATQYIKDYFEHYQGIKEYMNMIEKYTIDKGYVENLLGRKCFFELGNKKALHLHAKRAAINAPIQSLASDIVKIAMIKLDQAIRNKNLCTKIIMHIHDELVLEVPQDEIDLIKDIILDSATNIKILDIPLSINLTCGDNMLEMKELK